MACDFRFEKDTLKGLKYSICGLGNSLYEENFNKVAKELDKSFSEMSATQICRLYCCDENTVKSEHSSLEGDVAYWRNLFFEKLKAFTNSKNDTLSKEGVCCKSGGSDTVCCKNDVTMNTTTEADELESGNDEKEEDDDDDNYETTSDEDEEQHNVSDIGDEDEEEEGGKDSSVINGKSKKVTKIMKSKNGLIDLEDLGMAINNMERKKKLKPATNAVVKEMVTPLLRKSLEKQNYKIIGSHSGVKLCRWTKSMLRGRGGCYKHSFYGIESHRCMETTPSLACANKCVFCWRHHT